MTTNLGVLWPSVFLIQIREVLEQDSECFYFLLACKVECSVLLPVPERGHRALRLSKAWGGPSGLLGQMDLGEELPGWESCT